MLRLILLIASQRLVSLCHQLQHNLLQLRIRLMPFPNNLLEILDPLILCLNLLLLFDQLLFSFCDLLPQLLVLLLQHQLPWFRLLISLWLKVSHRGVHDVSDGGIVVGAVHVFVLHCLQALDLFLEEFQFFH
jgi:hypothetical protein